MNKKDDDDMGITSKWNQIKSKIQDRQPASATTDTVYYKTFYRKEDAAKIWNLTSFKSNTYNVQTVYMYREIYNAKESKLNTSSSSVLV